MSSLPLKNKTALITGSAQGIGAVIAKQLAHDGATIILHDLNITAAQQVAEEIRMAGGTVSQMIMADLSHPDAGDLVSQALGSARIDILVNNAGIAPVKTFEEMDAATFDKMLNINLRAVFFLTQKLLPHIQEGGRIINLSSSLKKTYVPGFIAYVAIKGFIEAFTKYLAGEVGIRGITVNAISPGAINTGLNPWFDTQEGKNTLLKDQALKSLGSPEYIADVVSFLSSAKACWISGTIVDVDGGYKLAP